MINSVRLGQTAVLLRIKIADTSQPDGRGLTGLSHTSSGLVISTITDNESTPSVYRSVDSTIEGLTTPGTYEAPTPGKCRLRELDAVNHRGVYELQLSDSRFAVPGAKSLLISVRGDGNVSETDALIALTIFDLHAPNGGFDPWSVSVPGAYEAGSAGSRMGWIDAPISSRSTYGGGPVQSVTQPVTVAANLDKQGYSLASVGVDAILVEGGINLRQAFAPILAALAGNVSRSASGTITILGANSSSPRITASTNSDGSRNDVALILPP